MAYGGRPLMVVGPVGAGKSSLLKALDLGETLVRKTQALTYLGEAIDTPGEILILNSARARLVLMVMDGSRPTPLPARLALALKAPVWGVVSKVDLADSERLIRAEAALAQAGADRFFRISALTGAGLDELKRELAESPAGDA